MKELNHARDSFGRWDPDLDLAWTSLPTLVEAAKALDIPADEIPEPPQWNEYADDFRPVRHNHDSDDTAL